MRCLRVKCKCPLLSGLKQMTPPEKKQPFQSFCIACPQKAVRPLQVLVVDAPNGARRYLLLWGLLTACGAAGTQSHDGRHFENQPPHRCPPPWRYRSAQ